jgi:hypothetical protein
MIKQYNLARGTSLSSKQLSDFEIKFNTMRLIAIWEQQNNRSFWDNSGLRKLDKLAEELQCTA